MDDGEVALDANHYQDEDGGRVAQAVHEQVHFAQDVPKHPAANIHTGIF